MLHVLFLVSTASSSLLPSCPHSPMTEIHSLYTSEKQELSKPYSCRVPSPSESSRLSNKLSELPTVETALVGSDSEMTVPQSHFVLHTPMKGPWSEHSELAVFGYAGGFTKNPTYEEVCSGHTGHTEVVQVVYDTREISFSQLLRLFWEKHNPTQGMQQGSDNIGTQYRSAVLYTTEEQRLLALESMKLYQGELFDAGFGIVSTEIVPLNEYYYAEEFHQQYLGKNPGGYCGLGGLGVPFPHWFVRKHP